MPENLFSLTNILSLLALFSFVVFLLYIKKIKLSTSAIVKISLAIALSVVLDKITLFKMAQGGSVTPGSMIPIIIISFIYGPQVGMLSGFLFGFMNLILGGSIVHPVQLLLDYPLAFMLIGLSGYLKPNYKVDTTSKAKIKVILAVLIASLGRLLCHFLSGIIFFSEYAGEMNPYLYSLIYNGSFLSVEFLICSIIMCILPLKRLIYNIKN